MDGDGKVSLADAQKILKLALRIIEPEDEFVRKQADSNGDGQITLADAQKVLRIALKIEN